MPVVRLRKIDHVCLRVADPVAAARRYAPQFGLTIRELGEQRSLLACDYEPYSLELVAADGAEVGFAHCAWQLRRSVSLDDARSHLRALGVDFDDHGDRLELRDGEGFELHLLAFADEQDRRPAIARRTHSLDGLRPRKLGHINRLSADLEGSARFYEEVLGMEVSDYLGDAGIWL